LLAGVIRLVELEEDLHVLHLPAQLSTLAIELIQAGTGNGLGLEQDLLALLEAGADYFLLVFVPSAF